MVEIKNIRMRKLCLITAIVLILSLLAMIHWSPYGIKRKLKKRAVVSSVEIKAPVEQVYNYLGKSAYASEWSVFVDNIIPLNTSEYDDGTVGSIRRCYAKGNAVRWDEEIIEVRKFKFRELSVFNAEGFVMMAGHLRTQQVYEPLSDDRTRLSLTLFFESKQDYIDELKMYLAAYEVSRIFDLNLKNIKHFNET